MENYLTLYDLFYTNTLFPKLLILYLSTNVTTKGTFRNKILPSYEYTLCIP